MPKISKRKDGRWETRIRISTENGKPRYNYIYGRTKKETEAKLATLITQVHSGTYIEPSKLTLGQWLTDWVSGRPNIRNSTREFYESLIRVHINPVLGELRLNELTTRNIQNFINDASENGAVKGGGLAPSTIRSIHVCILAALKQAIKERLILVNPAEAVELPKGQPREMKVLTVTQVKQFLAVAQDSPLYAALLLELATGLRRGELLGLWWTDIDFERGFLSLKRQLAKRSKPKQNEDRLYFSELKTKASQRQITLPGNVIRVLREHKKKQTEIRLLIGKSYRYPELLFASEEGKPLDPDTFRRQFKRILKAAGLPDVRFHDLRHTFVTMAIEAGIPIKTVQNILGHSKISTTLDTYGHVTPEMHQQAAETIGNILRSMDGVKT